MLLNYALGLLLCLFLDHFNIRFSPVKLECSSAQSFRKVQIYTGTNMNNHDQGNGVDHGVKKKVVIAGGGLVSN